MFRRLTLGLVSMLAAAACTTSPAPAPAPATNQRQDFLERFARGYYPGRSGQIFLVPKEGSFITDHDPRYAYTHGSPWLYDSAIPILFHGSPFIRPGVFDAEASQQDIAPTLAAILGTPPPATITGRVLRDALGSANARPKVIAVFALDGMRADYFERYAGSMPTLSRLKREGAWFSRARVNYLPTVTSVGHATIGTGTDPRFHGQASNKVFNLTTGEAQQAYAGLDPRELMTLTLADLWNFETEGRAVIIGQGGAIRAVAGLVGHGACIVGGKPVFVGSYETKQGGWETNKDCYRLPRSLEGNTSRRYWEQANGTWMGHDIAGPSKFRASSLFQKFEGDALVGVIDESTIGADDTTDLLLVNMKGPDYAGHAYGPESAELRETLAELDRQMTRVVQSLDRKAGAGQVVIAISADHGMPGEPKGDHKRIYWEQVVEAINRKFDPDNGIVRSYDDPTNQQIYMDRARLKALGFTLEDVAVFLEEQDYIEAAFTEDEVRSVVLPPPGR